MKNHLNAPTLGLMIVLSFVLLGTDRASAADDDIRLVVILLSGWRSERSDSGMANFDDAWDDVRTALGTADRSKPGTPEKGLRIIPFSYVGLIPDGSTSPTGVAAYEECNANQPIDTSATRLNKQVTVWREKFKNANFMLIGHSLGGVVASYWASQPDIDVSRVAAVVTIDSPVQGVSWASRPIPQWLREWAAGNQCVGSKNGFVNQLSPELKEDGILETISVAGGRLRGKIHHFVNPADVFIIPKLQSTESGRIYERELDGPYAYCATVYNTALVFALQSEVWNVLAVKCGLDMHGALLHDSWALDRLVAIRNSAKASDPPPALAAPVSPSNFSATAVSTSEIRLTWTDNSNNEQGFEITPRGGGAKITTGPGVTSSTVKGLPAGTERCFEIAAFNAASASSPRPSACATTQTPKPSVPAPPGNFTAAAVSTSEIKLTWADNSNNEQGFEITPRGGGAKISTGPGITSWTVTGLPAATEGCFEIAAFNAAGPSSPRPSACATTQAPKPSVPAPPGNFTAAAVSTSEVKLTWTDNSNNEQGFEITPRGGGAKVTTGPGVTSWTVTGLPAATERCFEVAAFNAAGASSPRPSACATTRTPTYAFTATLEGYTPGSVSWNSNGDLTLCYHLSPENVPFVLDVMRASDDLRIAGGSDDGVHGGDCIDISSAVREMLGAACSGDILVGAYLDGSYRGGRPRFTIKRTNCAPGVVVPRFCEHAPPAYGRCFDYGPGRYIFTTGNFNDVLTTIIMPAGEEHWTITLYEHAYSPTGECYGRQVSFTSLRTQSEIVLGAPYNFNDITSCVVVS